MRIQFALLILATQACLAGSMLDQKPSGRTIQASILVRDYDENPVAADQRYRGAAYTVGGIVERVVSDEEVYVELRIAYYGNVRAIRCLFENTRGLETLKAGAPISVAGVIDGMRNGRIIIRDCYLPR